MEKGREVIWAKGKKSGYYYRLAEGTGDALSQEDLDQGYVDYIYYDYFPKMEDVYNNEPYDGGCYYLKRLFQNYDVEDIVKFISEFEEEELEVIE